MLPGYQKDVYSWLHTLMGNEGLTKNVSSDLYNKLSMVPRTVWDTMANKDWSGHQIYNPNDPYQKKFADYMHYVQRNMMPIAVQQQMQAGQNKRSNIGRVEAEFGIRHAPAPIEEPKKAYSGTQKANKKAADEARKFHQRTGYDEGGVVSNPLTVTPSGGNNMWSDEDEARRIATDQSLVDNVFTRGMKQSLQPVQDWLGNTVKAVRSNTPYRSNNEWAGIPQPSNGQTVARADDETSTNN
jgi:hypothetical protein